MWEPAIKVADVDANVLVWNTPTAPVLRVDVVAPGLTVASVTREVVAYIQRTLSASEPDPTDVGDELSPEAPETSGSSTFTACRTVAMATVALHCTHRPITPGLMCGRS